MGQAQPKLSIGLVMRGRGELSALLDLVLEKIGRFEHCDSHNKSPAHRGFYQQTTRQVGICSACKISTARKFAKTDIIQAEAILSLLTKRRIELGSLCRRHRVSYLALSPTQHNGALL
jgi:hypothetical protein